MRTPLSLLALLFLLPALARAEEPDADGWHTTASGLRWQQVQAGEPGTEPHAGDAVVVHYVGTFADGRTFDASRPRGEPFRFTLGEGGVIAGWDEGVALMTVGSKFRFHVPWNLAYGAAGRPPKIPPRTDLDFEVDLLEVVRAPRFHAANPDHQITTDSGLVYEVLQEGTGRVPTPAQGVRMSFALWTPSGDLLFSTATSGQHLGGVVSSLRLGRLELPFLREIPLRMKEGMRVRCEVPAALGFGQQQVHPSLPPGSTTVWELELLSVQDVPPFRPLDAAKTATTPSGLAYEVIREGSGTAPRATDVVRVLYTGWLEDGTIFDSGHARGEPTEFPLNRVIAGWGEGLQLMKPGGKVLFRIPGALAYGSHPPPGSGIPADATLYFLVELLEVVGSGTSR